MSNFTDYAENRLADMVRGQAWSLPSSLYVGLAGSASDGSIAELSGTGYARQPVARSLTAWAGTQGEATTLASTGTSHATSNNGAINFGTAGSGWGEATHAVLYDASIGGNAIAYRELPTPLTIDSGDPVNLAAASLSFVLGLSGGVSDALSNKLIDSLFRGQAYAFPTSMHVGLLVAAPGNAGGGAEVSGGGYARAPIASTLGAWSGTQGPGSTSASTGTSGKISNNAALAFPSPSASWGLAGWIGIYAAATGSDLLFWAPLAQPKTIGVGAPPTFAAGSLSIAFA